MVVIFFYMVILVKISNIVNDLVIVFLRKMKQMVLILFLIIIWKTHFKFRKKLKFDQILRFRSDLK